MAMVKDPICGKEVDTLRARAVGIFGGRTCYFCSAECKARYVDPRKTPREPEAPPPASKKTEPPKKLALPAAPKKAAEPPPKKTEPPPKKTEPPVDDADLEPEVTVQHLDDELNELPPMPTEAAGGELDLPEPTPARSHKHHSPSVMAELGEMKRESRRWAVIIVILAALVVAAVVLSLRN